MVDAGQPGDSLVLRLKLNRSEGSSAAAWSGYNLISREAAALDTFSRLFR